MSEELDQRAVQAQMRYEYRRNYLAAQRKYNDVRMALAQQLEQMFLPFMIVGPSDRPIFFKRCADELVQSDAMQRYIREHKDDAE